MQRKEGAKRSLFLQTRFVSFYAGMPAPGQAKLAATKFQLTRWLRKVSTNFGRRLR